MGHIQQFVIGYCEKDRRSLLKFIGVISLIFIWVVLLMTYTFSFFTFISSQRESFEEGYHWVPSKAHTQADSGMSEQRRDKVPSQPQEVKDGLSTQEKNILSSFVLFGKALRGFQRDGKKGETKNR